MIVDPDDLDNEPENKGDMLYVHEEVAWYTIVCSLVFAWAIFDPATFFLGLVLSMPIGYVVALVWTIWRWNQR